MMWSYPCDDPLCPPSLHRPYAGGRTYPSITTLIEEMLGIGEGGAFKAARITSEYCYDFNDRFINWPREQAIQKASFVFKARWSTDADMGTHTHKAAEAFATGDGYEFPELDWDGDADRLECFIAGLKDWWDTRTPVVLASEFIVSNEDPRYIGTGDMLAAVAGEPTLLDFKTHREFREDESLRYRKWDLQLQMLGLASHLRHYHGKELIAQATWDEVGLARPARGLIVSIGPDGEWREYETPIDAEANMPMVKALCAAKAWKPALNPCGSGNKPVVVHYEPRPSAPVNVEAMLG